MTTYRKALLLEERDFGMSLEEDLEGLAEIIVSHLVHEVGGAGAFGFGAPHFEVCGFASERLGATWLCPQALSTPLWLKETGNFRTILARFKSREATAGQDRRAKQVAHAAAPLYILRFPDAREKPFWFSVGGSEELHDFRAGNDGPGTRVLAEIFFDWRQETKHALAARRKLHRQQLA